MHFQHKEEAGPKKARKVAMGGGGGGAISKRYNNSFEVMAL